MGNIWDGIRHRRRCTSLYALMPMLILRPMVFEICLALRNVGPLSAWSCFVCICLPENHVLSVAFAVCTHDFLTVVCLFQLFALRWQTLG